KLCQFTFQDRRILASIAICTKRWILWKIADEFVANALDLAGLERDLAVADRDRLEFKLVSGPKISSRNNWLIGIISIFFQILVCFNAERFNIGKCRWHSSGVKNICTTCVEYFRLCFDEAWFRWKVIVRRS